MFFLKIDINQQSLLVYKNSDLNSLIKQYSISTAKNGAGEQLGSGQTPRGWHIIRAKIGKECLINTVFIGRRPTGEIFTPALQKLFPERDWILTRIFWLSGLELGKNRLGTVDTMRRYIYLHGTPDGTPMGIPNSKGCIRMRNQDIIELFDMVPVGSQVLIVE